MNSAWPAPPKENAMTHRMLYLIEALSVVAIIASIKFIQILF